MATTIEPGTGSPAALVAIVRAARLTGDLYLEEVARRELRDRYGIRVYFDEQPEGDRE